MLAASCDTFGFRLGYPISFESHIYLLDDSLFFGRTCSTVLLGDPSMSSSVERPSLFIWMLHWISTEEHNLVFAVCGSTVP